MRREEHDNHVATDNCVSSLPSRQRGSECQRRVALKQAEYVAGFRSRFSRYDICMSQWYPGEVRHPLRNVASGHVS